MIPDVIRRTALIAIPIFHILGFIGVAAYCLRRRREGASTLLWLTLAWSFPIVGPLLFLMLGVTRVPQKAWRTQRANDAFRAERQTRESETMPLDYWRRLRESMADAPEDETARTLVKTMNRFGDEFPLLGSNAIEALVGGDATFPRMLSAIDNATDHIHLQTYILGNDATGHLFLEHLAAKARQGIVVRLMYDRIGSTSAWLLGMLKPYAHIPNFHIDSWHQMDLFKWRFQINLRNHRKALIIDGKIAFIGGINLHVENTTRPQGEPIRDYHFLVRGPIVHELQYTFLRDWHFMSDEDASQLLCERHFPLITPSGQSLISLVNGGPSSDVESLTDLFCAALAAATDQVLLVTPYFVPPPDILRAMRLASLRGVNIKLLMPEIGNHPIVALAARAFFEELLNSGIEIFLRPPPLLHAKALVVDDKIAVIGTVNLDNRSLRLNYETAFTVFDEPFANELKQIILEDLALSSRVDLVQWRNRPAGARIRENICALMAPVL
jgi:cardiolipin synthase A/B